MTALTIKTDEQRHEIDVATAELDSALRKLDALEDYASKAGLSERRLEATKSSIDSARHTLINFKALLSTANLLKESVIHGSHVIRKVSRKW